MKILREILSPLIAVFAAFVVGGILILLIKDNPFETYRLLLSNSFGSIKDVGYTLFLATPLIFTGLAVAVAFRCGLFNIGAEGQLIRRHLQQRGLESNLEGRWWMFLAKKKIGRG